LRLRKPAHIPKPAATATSTILTGVVGAQIDTIAAVHAKVRIKPMLRFRWEIHGASLAAVSRVGSSNSQPTLRN
jgi:hypothetical protein